jgi:hypothetical protein
MKLNKFFKYSIFIAFVSLFACTNLEEQVLDEQLGTDLINDPTNVEALINPPYASLRRTIEWYDYWAMQEVPTDEVIVPTRGSDWYDNGDWMALHLQTWTSDHVRVQNAWNVLNQGVSRSNTAIYYIGQFPQSETTDQYISEARFLRAYFMYLITDLYGQLPVREPDDLNFSVSPEVLDRKAAADYIIAELKSIIPNLKTKAQVGSAKVTVGAAKTLLAKIYLNYKYWAGEDKFADCITNCNDVIENPDYAVETDYWRMFQKFVEENSEFILRVPMSDDVDMGSGSVWSNFTLHYSQIFGNINSTWNGPSTTSTFFNTFDQVNDIRFHDDRIKAECGFNQGFLFGQQYSTTGVALTQRNGEPLIFVPEINLASAPENAGIRVIKFAPNSATNRQFSSPNDVPVMRISDVYLMRAEALLRSNNATAALADVNYIRARRSQTGKTLPLLTSVTLEDLLKERGFELYWEGVRRQDLARFGKLGEAWQEKPTTDGAKRAIFPAPTSAADVNENIDPNLGK